MILVFMLALSIALIAFPFAVIFGTITANRMQKNIYEAERLELERLTNHLRRYGRL